MIKFLWDVNGEALLGSPGISNKLYLKMKYVIYLSRGKINHFNRQKMKKS